LSTNLATRHRDYRPNGGSRRANAWQHEQKACECAEKQRSVRQWTGSVMQNWLRRL